jgi:hypothetical protein
MHSKIKASDLFIGREQIHIELMRMVQYSGVQRSRDDKRVREKLLIIWRDKEGILPNSTIVKVIQLIQEEDEKEKGE